MSECIGTAIDRREELPLQNVSLVFDPYCSDPRLAALLRRLNPAK